MIRRLILPLMFSLVAGGPTDRSIVIMNQSGRRVEVHWVPPNGGELVLQSKPDLLNGADLNLNSFVSHTFQVKEMPGKISQKCTGENEECMVGTFTVNSHENQVIFIRPGIEIEHSDTKKIAENSAQKILDTCRETAKESLASNPDDATTILEQLGQCVEDGISAHIEVANEEIKFQTEVRLDMSDLLEDYTCYDEKLESSEPKSSFQWKGRKVDVMLDRPSAKIHYIENFITQEECDAVHEEAKDDLEDATVADGKGGSTLDEVRKAKQANIEVDWENEANGDPIAVLSRRVYMYTNYVLPFNIDEDGQEDLMSIQYFGRGKDDKAPDQYKPHCDGDCDGRPFRDGERMATMVMYCEVPKVGGATNFMNAGIHIKPKKYAATFFSYINPETMIVDDELTAHSGCPVWEGEKKIVTQWIRLGVDEDTPWDSFDTMGIKKDIAENQ